MVNEVILGSFYSQLTAGVIECGMTLDESIACARAHGIMGADLAAADFQKMPAKELAAILASHDIIVASTHDSFACDYDTKASLEASFERVKRDMDDARAIGCPYFMIVPLPPKYHCPERQNEFVLGCRELFLRLAEYGKEIGIQATVENFSLRERPFSTYEDLDWIFANCPEMKFTYDSGNFPLVALNEIEALHRYVDKTVYCHLKDLEIVPYSTILRDGVYYEGPALDDGFVKNDEAVRILAANGYNGCLTIEICSGINVYEKLLLSADRYTEKLKTL